MLCFGEMLMRNYYCTTDGEDVSPEWITRAGYLFLSEQDFSRITKQKTTEGKQPLQTKKKKKQKITSNVFQVIKETDEKIFLKTVQVRQTYSTVYYT